MLWPCVVIIIIIMWIVLWWTLLFLWACSMSVIGSCQINVEPCQIWFNGLEPGMVWSAWWMVPVPWQRRHTGPKGSPVVHGRIEANTDAFTINYACWFMNVVSSHVTLNAWWERHWNAAAANYCTGQMLFLQHRASSWSAILVSCHSVLPKHLRHVAQIICPCCSNGRRLLPKWFVTETSFAQMDWVGMGMQCMDCWFISWLGTEKIRWWELGSEGIC